MHQYVEWPGVSGILGLMQDQQKGTMHDNAPLVKKKFALHKRL